MAIDIVCGKEVAKEGIDGKVGSVMAGAAETDPTKGTKSFYNGTWYYFCSMNCRHQFVATPDEILAKAEAAGYI